MITWLPRWRTRSNPCRSRISQTASPKKGRSLRNLYLNLREEHLWLEASVHFGRVGALKKQRQRPPPGLRVLLRWCRLGLRRRTRDTTRRSHRPSVR